jgi:hypothetical protein
MTPGVPLDEPPLSASRCRFRVEGPVVASAFEVEWIGCEIESVAL